MEESYPNGQKTLWEKEKLLVMSNFSFSHCVFKKLVSQGRQKVSLCVNGLNIFSNDREIAKSSACFLACYFTSKSDKMLPSNSTLTN